MKKQILASILLLILTVFPIFCDVTFYGKITGSGGEPISKSVAWVKNGRVISSYCRPDGSYSIKVPFQDRIVVNFSGINHDNYSFTFYPQDNGNYNLDAKLAPLGFEKMPDGLSITGSFNGFSFDDNLIKMTKDAQGIFHAEITGSYDTLKYQIVAKLQNGNETTMRSINGTQEDFFEFDNGGDFKSCILNVKNKIEIAFDPKYLTLKGEPELSSVNSEINDFRKMAKTMSDLYYQALNKMKTNIPEKTGISFDQLKKETMDTLNSMLKIEMSPSVRQLFAFRYMDIASIGGTMGNKSMIDPEMPKIVLTKFSPLSSLWEKYYNIPIECEKYNDNVYNSKFIDSMIKYNPSGDAREYSYYNLVRYALDRGDTTKMKEYYKQLKNDFPNGRAARDLNLAFNIEGNKSVVKGRQIPEFKLVSLDNNKDSISISDLKGKYVLIDVWGTWCMPCVNEMEHLHNIFEKYKNKNFTIYSIAYDNNPETIAKFRSKKWKMPWFNAFMTDGDASPVYDLLEITGFPKPILIDPNGKIIAVDSKARGEDLDRLLAELLD